MTIAACQVITSLGRHLGIREGLGRANACDLRNLSEKMQYVTFQVPSPTLGILAPVFKDAEKSAILKVNTKSVTI